MAERSFSSPSYRYGFNGAEKTDEVKGEGNHYDLGFRNYDPRLGRMFKIDPRTTEYPWQSPYVYHRNSPIWRLDYLGGGDDDVIKGGVLVGQISALGVEAGIIVASGQTHQEVGVAFDSHGNIATFGSWGRTLNNFSFTKEKWQSYYFTNMKGEETSQSFVAGADATIASFQGFAYNLEYVTDLPSTDMSTAIDVGPFDFFAVTGEDGIVGLGVGGGLTFGIALASEKTDAMNMFIVNEKDYVTVGKSIYNGIKDLQKNWNIQMTDIAGVSFDTFENDGTITSLVTISYIGADGKEWSSSYDSGVSFSKKTTDNGSVMIQSNNVVTE